jgi:hypothetical protein
MHMGYLHKFNGNFKKCENERREKGENESFLKSYSIHIRLNEFRNHFSLKNHNFLFNYPLFQST